MIIGITGTIGAGKGTIVEYLTQKKNFTHLSVRDLLVKEIKRKKMKVDRDSFFKIGNELRAKYGPSYIAQELLKEAQKLNKDCVIESLRAEAEVVSLKGTPNFYLLAISAKPRLRYSRIKKRNSETDKISYKEFLDNEKREMVSTDPTKQNISKCISLADYTVTNNSTRQKLFSSLEKIMKKIEESQKYVRPTWEEYFFEVMNAISKRATCDRGRAGSVAVRDNQVLVTGYVGSPVGLPHCDDVGHLLKSMTHEDGSVTKHCVRTVHSEQNLICQAAKRGVCLEGAEVYTRMTPCRTCAMLLINSGIKAVHCERKYHTGEESEYMFKKAKVKITYKFNELQTYKNM